MKKEDLLKLFDEATQKAKALMESKNHDYSKNDALTNLTMCESMGICTAAEGIVIRMTDKLSRLASILPNGAMIKTETVEDTAIDMINYAVLLLAVTKPVVVINVNSEKLAEKK